MSLIDSNQLSDEAMITQLILECRGEGLFLPYSDHQIIQNWISTYPDFDRLLLILADLLPQVYKEEKARGKRPKLQSIDRLVRSRLESHF